MGGVNVKNTMIEWVLDRVAPHPCLSCGKIGSILCQHCKYNINEEPFVGCFVCATPHQDGICERHNISVEKSFVVGQRTGVLRLLLDALKFQRSKAAARVAAALLDERLPLLPANTLLVPIPTLRHHVRQRGYDQVLLITKYLAVRRSLEVAPLLRRVTATVQHELSREERQMAGKAMFALDSHAIIDTSRPHLIIDDIITTGATVIAASDLLVASGATTLVAGIAYQPLD